MFFTPGSPQYADAFLPAFSVYLSVVVCWTIVMTLLWERTDGSVLVCMLFHASLNVAAFSIRIPPELDLVPWLLLLLVIAAAPGLSRPRIRAGDAQR